MEKIYPWDSFELNSSAYPTAHEGVRPCHMPSTREENEIGGQHKILK